MNVGLLRLVDQLLDIRPDRRCLGVGDGKKQKKPTKGSYYCHNPSQQSLTAHNSLRCNFNSRVVCRKTVLEQLLSRMAGRQALSVRDKIDKILFTWTLT